MTLNSGRPGNGILDHPASYDIETHLRSAQSDISYGMKIFSHGGIRQRKDDHVTFESLEPVHGLSGNTMTIQRGE